MKKINVNPHQIGTWHPGGIKAHKEPLELILKRDGWKNIPRVPIFELPEGHAHKYVLIDGHARHAAAIKTNSLLSCSLYARGEPVDVAKDGLASFGYQDRCSKEGFYETVVAMYEFYEQKLCP